MENQMENSPGAKLARKRIFEGEFSIIGAPQWGFERWGFKQIKKARHPLNPHLLHPHLRHSKIIWAIFDPFSGWGWFSVWFSIFPYFLWGHFPFHTARRDPKIFDPSIPPEELLGPSGPKLETELKMSSWGLLAPGPRKLKSESKKRQKVEISTLSAFVIFFRLWFQLFGELIFNSVSNFGPEGPKSSSGGINQSRFLGRGCEEALFSEKRGFQWKGGRRFSELGFGKDFYRKGNSVKRSGRFSEPPDSEKWKVAVLIPFPKISS